MSKFLDLVFDKCRIRMKIENLEDTVFKRKYNYFKSLLSNNNKALALINDLENMLLEHKPFEYEEVVEQCEELIKVVYEIAEDINAISGGKYPDLFTVAEKTGISVLKHLVERNKLDRAGWTIPLARLSHESRSQVGSKAANLAEISNRVNLPTPRGFSVTAFACHHFFRQTGLYERIKKEMKGLDVNKTQELENTSFRVKKLIMDAHLPSGVEKAITKEVEALTSEFGHHIRLAVRSSATGEDSHGSTFAGQHSSVLNVSPDNVIRAYKEVVSSTFNPRAVFYRRNRGYRDMDVLMAVLCLIMVDARSSGCLYTIDPNDALEDDVVINANWGLGVSVVDGSMPTDYWRISKKDQKIIDKSIPEKNHMQVMGRESDLKTTSVPAHKKTEPCLNPEQIKNIVSYGLKLESYFGWPLDIEWAVDRQDSLFILQARPLQRVNRQQDQEYDSMKFDLQDHQVLLSGGMTASPGSACGPAYILKYDHNLSAIPEGSILVAPHTSPKYVSAMNRVKGIITDVGSVTGHMASVAREFGIPTLVGTSSSTATLEPYELITLDASRRLVLKGHVQSILKEKPRVNILKDSPMFKAVRETLKQIVPLHLVDPESDSFSPRNCRTLHDIVRFCHEMAMREMFRLGEDVTGHSRYMAVKLLTRLPLNIFVLDLGGGTDSEPGQFCLKQSQIISTPFQALLKGMHHKDVQWAGRNTAAHDMDNLDILEYPSDKNTPEDHPGGPNYAIVSDEYVNFNLRLGYHFVTIDSFCSERVNDNYIKLSFKGGAADVGLRTRRAVFIAMVLKKMGFRANQKGDMLEAEMKKYDLPRLEGKLDLIGRLLGSIRLLDMALPDDGDLPWYVDEFLRGNYAFKHN